MADEIVPKIIIGAGSVLGVSVSASIGSIINYKCSEGPPKRSGDGCGEARITNYISNEHCVIENARRLCDDPSELVTNLWTCKSVIEGIPEGIPLVYHTFIVLQTKRGFWSFDKNDEGIFGQVTATMEECVNKFYNTPRKGEVTKKYNVNKCSIGEFLGYIIDVEFRIPYDVKHEYNNCQGFTNRIVTKFGQST